MLRHHELELALRLAKELPVEALPRFLGDLEEIRATVQARLVAPAPQPPEDKLVSVKQAALRVGFSWSYLYHHPEEFPFLKKKKNGRWGASSLGINRYLEEMS